MDNDIDALLLQQFSSMATEDRDVLIAEFKRLLGDPLNDTGCAFFLDMNNWNLQDAICSYFEYQAETPTVRLPRMIVLSEDGRPVFSNPNSLHQKPHLVAPSACFTKSWHIKNSGSESWPPGCCLCFVAGQQMSQVNRVVVDSLAPGTSTHVHLEVESPAERGSYKGEWRMSTMTGSHFGDSLWLSVHVCDEMGPSSEPLDALCNLSLSCEVSNMDGGDLPAPTADRDNMDLS